MLNTNDELLRHIQYYKKHKELSEEGWLFLDEFVRRLGYSGGAGYAKKYPNLWDDMRSNAFDYIIKSTLPKCVDKDPDMVWAYISKCVYGIFTNTLNNHKRELGRINQYGKYLEDADKDKLADTKDRPKAIGIDAKKDEESKLRNVNYFIKNGGAEYITICDDKAIMDDFIGRRKLKVLWDDDKVVITLPNGDVGYSGDMLFRKDSENKSKTDLTRDTYWMLIPEYLANIYNGA